jgi:hypothetical protein
MRDTKGLRGLGLRGSKDSVDAEYSPSLSPSVPESLFPGPLACIIRERHATEGFGRQRIAEEEDGSVKLMRGTWLQALQAHTIEVATILGRGFALCSFGSGENGNSSGERS